MSDKHNKQREDIGEDLNIAQILMIGVSYALVVAICMVFLAALHQKKTREETESKSATTEATVLEEAQAQQAVRIGSYDWADYQAGAIRLPIERAMELTVARLAAGEPLGLAGAESGEPQTMVVHDFSEPGAAEEAEPEAGTEEL